MLFCSDKRNLEGNIVRNIIPRNKRIYYDAEKDLFYNQDNRIINVKDRVVVPLSNENSLEDFYNLLKSKGVLFTNKLEDVPKIEKWYEYIEPHRCFVPFTKKDLSDLSFLTYLIELFGNDIEVYLSSTNESIPVDMSDLIQGIVPLKDNQNNEFLLSTKLDIDEDEYGKVEYQALIERGKIIKVSRLVETDEYIKLPVEVFTAINEFLADLPSSFPKTFVMRIASTKNMYDLLDIRPLEKIDQFPSKKLAEDKGHKLSKTSK